MRTRMILVVVGLLMVAGCVTNSPVEPSVNASEKPTMEGGYMGSGD